MFCLVKDFLKSIASLSSLAELKVHQVKLDADICKCYTWSMLIGFWAHKCPFWNGLPVGVKVLNP